MQAEPVRRYVAWDKVDGYGVELADVTLYADHLVAVGVAIGWNPFQYRLDAALETGAGWITSRLNVMTQGDGWTRKLDLRRSPTGSWTIEASSSGNAQLELAGGDAGGLSHSLDCDLGLSPLTNTMPILRHDLLNRLGSFDFVMAWVSVPALSVRVARQRYTSIATDGNGVRHIEYRSLDSDFVSEITVDADGLVVDYPRLATRVPRPDDYSAFRPSR